MGNDHGTMGTMEQTSGSGDREETVLASPSVQATVDGATWTGTAEVLLDRGPRPFVSLECLFDQGIEPHRAADTVREPERVKRLIVDGKMAAGHGTRATFFDDNDGAKLLVAWRPESPAAPLAAVLADLGLRGVER